MNSTAKYFLFGALGLVIVGVLIVAFTLVGWVGWSNDANGFETDIPAQYKVMQNVYDNGWKQVMEQNQLSDKYAEQFKDAFQAIMRGDKEGQQALIQVLTAMPNYDSSVVKKVMESVETFHSNFSAAQTTIIAKKQAYGRFLTTNTDSRFYNMFSKYPHIHCGVPDGTQDDYQIVTSAKTQEDFRRHEAAPLDLRDKK